MSERTYYVLCDDNCKFESMTKEQIIAAIEEATGVVPTDIDEAFITKIKEQNGSESIKIWVGTEAEYNAMSSHPENMLYFIKNATGGLVYKPIEGNISYESLNDLPMINGNELLGDTPSSELGLSYNDLSDRPTIPAAQVNSDWNATSGKARILNKPTIPVIRSGSTDPTGGSNGDIYIKY